MGFLVSFKARGPSCRECPFDRCIDALMFGCCQPRRALRYIPLAVLPLLVLPRDRPPESVCPRKSFACRSKRTFMEFSRQRSNDLVPEGTAAVAAFGLSG
jgi:hypothetical protein